MMTRTAMAYIPNKFTTATISTIRTNEGGFLKWIANGFLEIDFNHPKA